MRFWHCTSILLVLVGCTSCAYEAKHKTETAIEQALDQFHEQLNHEQYHEIYSRSDSDLQDCITEAEFAAQLRNAHEQLGKTSGKAIVIINDTLRRNLRRAFGSKREIISHWNGPVSDVIVANERFVWAVENDQPKLLSYEFQSVCRKPCTVGFGR